MTSPVRTEILDPGDGPQWPHTGGCWQLTSDGLAWFQRGFHDWSPLSEGVWYCQRCRRTECRTLVEEKAA